MDRNNRIEDKLDSIHADITDIKVTLAKQHVVLVEHESRSTKLETIVLPIHRKVLMAEGIIKFLAASSIIFGLIKALKMLL